MKKTTLSIFCLILFMHVSFAKKEEKDSVQVAIEKQLQFIDSVESSLKWETKTVAIGNGIANLKITDGFKFLNAEQSKFILHDVWGNPPRQDVLGMIFPENGGPYADSSFAFLISFQEDGYVKDDDADKIDYDDMLQEIKDGEKEGNLEREKEGYEPIYMIGWAAKPYYDKSNRVLHWAKELKFGTDEINTLNYDVRVLGRKGILSLNAIATVDELPLVKANIDKVLKMPEFTAGNKYSDYNSSTDKVAGYSIGALVAGTVLAKTGILAMIGKMLIAGWKFILIGLVAIGGGLKKIFTGRKNNNYQEDEMTT